MRLPRLTIKRSLIAVAVTAVVMAAVRQFVGDYCRRQAYDYGAAANTAMMDVAGLDSEASSALKEGDQKGFLSLRQQLATAQAQEAYWATRSERYRQAASLLGMAVEDDIPPGVPAPIPLGPPQRQTPARP